MRIALAQMDIAWLDPATNLARIEERLAAALREGAELVVFPEMALTGFCMTPEEAALPLDSAPVERLLALTRGSDALVVVGVAVREGASFTNRALVLRNGALVGSYAKIGLFSLAGEHEVYTPGRELLVVEHRGFRFAPLVCYDLRFPELVRRVADEVDALVVIASWAGARAAHWRTFVAARALDAQAFVVAVNRVGAGGGVDYTGDSAVFAPTGTPVLDFLVGERLACVDVDLTEVRAFRERLTVLRDRRALPDPLPVTRVVT